VSESTDCYTLELTCIHVNHIDSPENPQKICKISALASKNLSGEVCLQLDGSVMICSNVLRSRFHGGCGFLCNKHW